MKWVFKQQNFHLCDLKANKCNFHPLEVVGRGSEYNFKWVKIKIRKLFNGYVLIPDCMLMREFF